MSDRPFAGYNKKRHARTGGLNERYRKALNRKTGSNLQAPVTESNPSKDRAARRRSFCARMSGNPGKLYKFVDSDRDGDKEKKPTPKLMALRRWRCKV